MPKPTSDENDTDHSPPVAGRGPRRREGGLNQFLADRQALVEPREIANQTAAWTAEMNATPENQARAAATSASLDECYADADVFAALRAFPEPRDQLLLLRQRDILLRKFAATCIPQSAIEETARMEAALNGIFGSFRAEFGGRTFSDNELRSVLLRSNDSVERRDAWAAGKQVGDRAAAKLIALVKVRNKAAHNAGFDNYYAMCLTVQEIDGKELFALLDGLADQTAPAFRLLKAQIDSDLSARFGAAQSALRPWHYGDPFFQEPPVAEGASLDPYFASLDLVKMATDFFDAIGLPIGPMLPLADLYERPGKSQHAFCNPVGRGGNDIRVCCNLRQDAKWMSVLLHEYGHAIYHRNIDQTLPFFVRDSAHIANNEAIAQLMGRFVTNQAWLMRWAGVRNEEAAGVAKAAHEQHVAHLLIFTQWVLVMCHFERALYNDPTQDLDALWWRLVQQYQRVTPPDEPPTNAWAAKIHLSLSPVYYHGYLMGEAICSQILHSLHSAIGSDEVLVDSPKVGEWLIERYFKPGALYPWNDHIRHATGEPLNTRYIVDEVS